jgi:hypothetical protein
MRRFSLGLRSETRSRTTDRTMRGITLSNITVTFCMPLLTDDLLLDQQNCGTGFLIMTGVRFLQGKQSILQYFSPRCQLERCQNCPSISQRFPPSTAHVQDGPRLKTVRSVSYTNQKSKKHDLSVLASPIGEDGARAALA